MGKQFLMFQRLLVSSSSGSSSFLGLPDHEDKGNMILQNMRNSSANGTSTSRARRMRELQIFKV
jgi:hypothetical protein